MHKLKPSIATASRFLMNTVLVFAMVLVASLVGVGGAALWIYGRPMTAPTMASRPMPHLKTDVAAADTSTFPQLSPVRSDDAPAQLTPARYVPSDSEIATLSDTPRYTYVSYDGGRQQAHLRVTTVLSTSVPAPLTAPAVDAAPVEITDRPPLSDAASHYITDAQGRVIGVDGTAGAAAEARAQQVTIARALPVQPANFTPEVRVAYPVITRKALPVDADASTANSPGTFDVQAELAREDTRPVLHALPVSRSTRSARPNMFGASDSFQSFGSN